MKQKIEILRDFIAAEEWGKALKLAASWPDQIEIIKAAWAAYSNRNFYKQLKKDPDQMVREGISALKHRYHLPN